MSSHDNLSFSSAYKQPVKNSYASLDIYGPLNDNG